MLTRVARTAAAVLTHTFEVGETPTDATGNVVVTVKDPDGTTVSTGNAIHGTTGVYTYALPGQAALTELTVSWAATIAGTAVVETDTVEVVGGFFFSLSEGRASDTSLSDTNKYPGADLVAARLRVEQECERICDRAFVPRYARVTLNGTDSSEILLTHPDPDRSVAHVRSIRSVSMAPRADETFVDFTTAQLAALNIGEDGTLRRLDGLWWTAGFGNVVIEYEYGLDEPPDDLIDMALLRFRTRLTRKNSAVPDRASSFTSADGGTYRLTLPDAFRTGIPDVDAVYSRYSRRSTSGAGGRQFAASRMLSYDPQYNSLFHGGRR